MTIRVLVSITTLLDATAGNGRAERRFLKGKRAASGTKTKSLKITLDTLEFESMVRLLAATPETATQRREKEFEITLDTVN